MKLDIMITGVGGQGTVLASRLLATAAIKAGYFVRTSETIGMAQRGGCVVSHVRIGSEKSNPIIPFGMADLIIGYEPFEAARNIRRLSPKGKCIVNVKDIKPFMEYPQDDLLKLQEALDLIKKHSASSIFINGNKVLEKLGGTKMLNVYLIGVAAVCGLFPFQNKLLEKSMLQIIPPKHADMNIKTLNLGFGYDVSLGA